MFNLASIQTELKNNNHLKYRIVRKSRFNKNNYIKHMSPTVFIWTGLLIALGFYIRSYWKLNRKK